MPKRNKAALRGVRMTETERKEKGAFSPPKAAPAGQNRHCHRFPVSPGRLRCGWEETGDSDAHLKKNNALAGRRGNGTGRVRKRQGHAPQWYSWKILKMTH